MTVGTAGAVILIVDDDPVVRLLTAQTLAAEGYRVVEADDGVAAQARFAAAAPELILLDVLMPGLDGFGFCRWLREQPTARRVPVLMMTALDDSESIERAFEVGATDFIAKPISWPILVHRVRFLLRSSQTLEALASSQEALAEAQRLARLGSWTLDHASGAVSWSEEVYRIFELAPGEFGGTYAAFLDAVHPEDREWVDQIYSVAVRNRTQYDIEHRLLLPDGRVKWVHERGLTAYGPDGKPRLTRGTAQDITERRESEETIRYLSMYDGLTGLPNRTLFTEQVGRAIGQAQRRHGQAAVLHVGLDRFVRVNDSFGHEAGDELLRQVAQRLRASVRAMDYLGRTGESEVAADLGRWGGDEFVVLLSDVRSSPDAARVARRLLDDVSRPYRLNGQEITLSASVGVAVYPGDGATATQLVSNANAAMNYAKEHERGSFHFYTRKMNADSWLRLSLENDLRRALSRDELRLYYQPQVDGAGRLSGVEALVRWQHPEHGLLAPDRFIGLAEDSGLIIPLGEWVLHTACAQIKAWRDRGHGMLPIAVNLSTAQFQHRDLFATVMAALATADLPGEALELELTESMIMEHVVEGRSLMERLHGEGLRLAIDDFGTGYSSLSYLSSLPLHTLKVDRAFVREMLNDRRQAAIVRGIVALAKSLSLGVVAEGVETEEQAAALRQEGCDRLQGYLYDRPLPAHELERWFVR
jgi:diguanylate cyclase (GGDEF)-like protein/PAS domain S-box-containing protein